MDKELLAIVPDRERKKGKRVAYLLAKVYLRLSNVIMFHAEAEDNRK